MNYTKITKRLNDSEKKLLYKLNREIENGDVYAMEKWATFFAYDHPELVSDDMIVRILSYYETAVQKGIGRAMLNLGAMYYNGVFIKQDFEKAVHLYTMASNCSDSHTASRAIRNLGYCYYYGRSVAVNKERAFSYFLKGAMQHNDPSCLYKLGDMYRYGDFVETDHNMAFILYDRAFCMSSFREECTADIQKRLGECKLYGIGTEKDVVSALKHLSNAKGDLYCRIHIKKDPFAKEVLSKVVKLIQEAEEILTKDTIL